MNFDYEQLPCCIEKGSLQCLDFENTLLNCFNEANSENSDNERVDEDYYGVSDHDSASEAEADSEDEAECIEEMKSESEESSTASASNSTNFYDKNRYKWSSGRNV